MKVRIKWTRRLWKLTAFCIKLQRKTKAVSELCVRNLWYRYPVNGNRGRKEPTTKIESFCTVGCLAYNVSYTNMAKYQMRKCNNSYFICILCQRQSPQGPKRKTERRYKQPPWFLAFGFIMWVGIWCLGKYLNPFVPFLLEKGKEQKTVGFFMPINLQ